MRPLNPWTFTADGMTFKATPLEPGRFAGLRIGWTITRGDGLLANGVSLDAYNAEQLLSIGRAAFYRNGSAPEGHPAEWYADIMMRMVYEAAPFEPIAPEGLRIPDGAKLAQSVRDNDFPPNEYVVEGLFEPGALYYLASRFKTGKTLLLNDLIDSVATGGTFLARQAQKGAVVWLQLEDTLRSIVRRWRRLYPHGRVPENITLDQAPWRLSDANLEGTVRRLVDDQIALVVIDPMISAFPPHDINSPTESRGAMELFRRLARDSNTVVTLAAHHRKTEGEFGDQISGSHQQAATVDGFIEMRRTKVSGQRRISFIGRDWPDLPDELVQIDPDTLRLQHLGTALKFREEEGEIQAVEDAATLVGLVGDDERVPSEDLRGRTNAMTRARFAKGLESAIANGELVKGPLVDHSGKHLRGNPKGVWKPSGQGRR